MIASEPISSKTISRKQICLLWAGSVLFYFIIMLCAPYTYDDYEFAGLKLLSVSDLIHYCITYGNGRFIGNMIGVASNQIPVVGVFIKSIVLGSVVILIPQVLGLKSPFAYVLSFVLTAAIDPELFAQVYTWTSGFSNYVPCVCLILVALLMIQRYPSEQAPIFTRAAVCFALFIIGLSAQLFVEHSSIANIALAAVVLYKTYHDKDRCRFIPALVFFLGTLIGLILMFWIPAYFYTHANNHTDGYRSVHINGIKPLVYCVLRNLMRISNHFLGLSGIPLCAGAAITVYMTRHKRSRKYNQILFYAAALPGFYLLTAAFLKTDSWYGEPAILYHTIVMLCVLAPLFVWVLSLFYMDDCVFRNRALALLGIGVFVLLPILIVTPIHIRIAYHTQVCIIMAFLLCVSKWAEGLKINVTSILTRITKILAVTIVLTLIPVFFSIHSMANARHVYTLQQMQTQENEIEFFRIPFQYVHDSTDSGMGDYYYYEHRRDIEFNITPFEQWMNDHFDIAN